MDFVIVLAVLAVVVFIVSGPLRRPPQDAVEGPPGSTANGLNAATAQAPDSEPAELEAARDAKYREIRDAELDHRTGKLSAADYEAVDSQLRAEALEILRALDRATGAEAP